MHDCPQCGDKTPDLHEGYCLTCCAENQEHLDAHNASADQWAAMDGRQRNNAIGRAIVAGMNQPN
jgi:hypothetical protein